MSQILLFKLTFLLFEIFDVQFEERQSTCAESHHGSGHQHLVGCSGL